MCVLNLQSHRPSGEVPTGTALQVEPVFTLGPPGPCAGGLCAPPSLSFPEGSVALLSLPPQPVTGWQMAKDPHHTIGPGYNPVIRGSWGCRQPERILNLDRILGAGALDSSLSNSSAKSRPLNPVRVTTPPCGHFWKCTRGRTFPERCLAQQMTRRVGA